MVVVDNNLRRTLSEKNGGDKCLINVCDLTKKSLKENSCKGDNIYIPIYIAIMNKNRDFFNIISVP